MWVFMLSSTGMPFTGGMLGKLYVFSAAYEAGWWWLVVAGVIATASRSTTTWAVVRSIYCGRGSTAAGARRRLAAPRPAAASASSSPRRHVGSFFVVQPLIELASDAAASCRLTRCRSAGSSSTSTTRSPTRAAPRSRSGNVADVIAEHVPDVDRAELRRALP